MVKIKNTGFFKKTVEHTDNAPQETASVQEQQATDAKEQSEQTEEPPIQRVVRLPHELMQNVKATAEALNKTGFPGLARDVASLYRKVLDEHFTVAVVGEFNRGKSTLINRVLGREILPVSDLPTTALFTRITFGKPGKIKVYDKEGKEIKELPLAGKSWEGLKAANFGEKEPEGHVVVETGDPWLGKYGIDILDTPGAGDLEERRAQVIERCLVGADAAIVAISATTMLSLTEQSFIRHKIMSRGIPFMAIALTKLDEVPVKDREAVITFLYKKLESLKLKIPVVIADDSIEIPGGKYDSIVGIDKLKSMVLSWMCHNERQELMRKWLVTNVRVILNSAAAMIARQKEIIDAGDAEREELIAKRNAELSKVHGQWETLREELRKRCQMCINEFKAKAAEYGNMITETLQHEVARVPVPKDWLENEYSYRVKRELSAMSLSLDNFVAKQVTADLRWLNGEMSRQFKEMVGMEVENLMAKEDFRPDVNDKAIRLASLKDQSVKATVVSSALTLGAALMLGASGAAPLILATMGVGTGANIISRKLLEKKGEQQRETLKKLIAGQLPQIIEEASADSSVKIKIIYNDIINEAFATESRWMQTQRTLIRQSVASSGGDAAAKVSQQAETVESLKKLFI